MKKSFLKYIAAPAIALGLFSCSENDTDPRISTNPAAAEFTTNFDTPYTFEEHGDAWETLEWKAADYGIPTAVTYEVQIAKTEDFSNAQVLATTTGTSATIDATVISNKMVVLGYDPEIAADLYLRIRSYIINEGDYETMSEVSSANITPLIPLFPLELNIVGKLTHFGDWTLANAAPMTTPEIGVFHYEGFFDLGFKLFDPSEGETWENTYGYGDFPTKNISKYLENDGGNFSVVKDAAGEYRCVVNFKTESVTMLKKGLLKVGSVNGWNGGDEGDNQAMTETEKGSNIWELEVELQFEEQFKFVPVFTDWSVSYGYSDLSVGSDDFVDDGGNIKYVGETAVKTIVVDLNTNTLSYKE